MSFSFSQALLSETCPLTQPMGSDGHSQGTIHQPFLEPFFSSFIEGLREGEPALAGAVQPGDVPCNQPGLLQTRWPGLQ